MNEQVLAAFLCGVAVTMNLLSWLAAYKNGLLK